VPGDPGKIIHQRDGILKHIVVDPLQSVAVAGISPDQKSIVYIAVTKGLDRIDRSLHLKA